MSEYPVLVVALDYMLLLPRTLFDAVFLGIKSQPFCFFLLLAWVPKGKRYLRDELAQRVCLKASTHPNAERRWNISTCLRQPIVEHVKRMVRTPK
jgi:hypothetical protein